MKVQQYLFRNTFLLLIFIIGCKKKSEDSVLTSPILSTNIVSAITSISATSGGNISSDGGASIIARGVCWSTTNNPTIVNSKTTDGAGTGSFTSNLISLIPNTIYYIRAYATNNVGTSYGNEVSFTSSISFATLTTAVVVNITGITATSGGNIINDGGAPITERGVCWSSSFNPTVANSKTSDGTGIGSFISNLTGLMPNTTYYVRAYATNSVGTAYGNEISFRTLAILATITTIAISNFPGTAANGGGNISSDGGASITARGVCWNTTSNPTIANSKTIDGTGTGSFTSILLDLTPNTTYYVRAYATNSIGTAYGNEISFTSTQSTTFFIGQNYGGGIIFYIDGTGQHGLISSFSDQFSGIIWYNGSFVTTGATSTIDGSANTNLIINVQGLGMGTYAARICREYNGGGFTDWFLPAKDQLNILYSQKIVVGGFTSSANYWSSTEYDSDLAWLQYFLNGIQFFFNKSSWNNVRAIRAF